MQIILQIVYYSLRNTLNTLKYPLWIVVAIIYLQYRKMSKWKGIF